MTVYTDPWVRTDDLEVGDSVMIEHMMTYGPITAIHPHGHGEGWRYAVFANGNEITMTPGSCWFPG